VTGGKDLENGLEDKVEDRILEKFNEDFHAEVEKTLNEVEDFLKQLEETTEDKNVEECETPDDANILSFMIMHRKIMNMPTSL